MIPIRMSYTRNLACPEKHQRLYQLGEEEPKADFTQWGTMHHLIAEDYTREISRLGLARCTPIYIRIFNDHTELVDWKILEDMQDIGERWVRMFQLDDRVEHNHCELELAVNRNFEVIPYNEALDANGMALQDCFTGVIDYIGVFFVPERALHWEYKFGNQMFDMWEAQKSLQVQGYVYLFFKSEPRCQHIGSTLFAPKFNQISVAGFDRDKLVPEFEAHLAKQWARADMLREKYGDGPWPAEVNYRDACCFCRLYPYCAKKREVIARWKRRLAA
jgi:hypothetical protein